MRKISITQEELDYGEGQFDQYMQYVFQKMAQTGLNPELAVFQAIDLIRKDGYSVGFGLGRELSGISVENWIANNLGRRQNISWCLPYIAYPIAGVAYYFRMPIIRPESMLLTQAVVDITPDREIRLSERQISQIEEDYNEFYDALEKIVKFDSTTIIHLESSAQRIYENDAYYALSRWESLHFIERAMKEVLELSGISETGSKGHDIKGVLHDRWQGVGKIPLPSSLLDSVHCTPKIRYQRTPSSFSRAIQAHHDSIRLAALIAKEMPSVAPMEDSIELLVERGASLAIARILPALSREKSLNKKVKIIRDK